MYLMIKTNQFNTNNLRNFSAEYIVNQKKASKGVAQIYREATDLFTKSQDVENTIIVRNILNSYKVTKRLIERFQRNQDLGHVQSWSENKNQWLDWISSDMKTFTFKVFNYDAVC